MKTKMIQELAGNGATGAVTGRVEGKRLVRVESCVIYLLPKANSSDSNR